MSERELIAVRDPFGWRPLALGKLDGAYVVASESCALDLIHAEFIREIEPGEVLIIDENGLRSERPFPEERPAFCMFEYVYFARPDSMIGGVNVGKVRMKMGRELARRFPVDADIVVPVPDSGNYAALGFAEELKIPYAHAFVRNHYIGRTFLQPSQLIRDFDVRVKLNLIKEMVAGKRVVVIDDSIVRGTTARARVGTLREAGATEVHMRVSCPPHRFACHYGIDFPDPEKLIANQMSMEDICKYLGVDSLGYLDVEGMVKATGKPLNTFCLACFTGDYPLPVDPALDKFIMERREGRAKALADQEAHPTLFASPKKNRISFADQFVISAFGFHSTFGFRHFAGRVIAKQFPTPPVKSVGRKKAYASAGVDVDLGNRLKRDLHLLVKQTHGPQMLGKVGGFGGLFRANFSGLREPVLVSSIDGVGTKLKVAFAMNKHDTVGADLVNHCVNDIAVLGARPLFFLDYIGCEKLDPAIFQQLLRGFSRACRSAGCALIGGETAQMPKMYRKGEYDLAGCIVGVVDRAKIIDGRKIRPGDVILGLASNGLHTNGYSLARKILFEKMRLKVRSRLPGSKTTVGQELLRVHKNYQALLAKIPAGTIKGLAHITGGGLIDNLPRILPTNCDAVIETKSWKVPAIFQILQQNGDVDPEEMYQVFNMGIGMVAIVAPHDAVEVMAALRAKRVGRIERGTGKTRLSF